MPARSPFCVIVLFVAIGCSSLAPATQAGTQTIPGVRYLSPVPGSRYLQPETEIALRLADGTREPGTIAIEATGSSTGLHAGSTRLSHDGRTVLFRPEIPFAWGETVTVSLRARHPGSEVMETMGGYTFTIAPRPVAISELVAGNDPESDPLARLASPAAVTGTLDFPPAITSTIYGTPSHGRIFLANDALGSGSPAPYLLIVDNNGHPVADRELPYLARDFKVQPNGRLTYFDSFTFQFFVLDSNFVAVDSLQCGNGYRTDTHELRILPDGSSLLMAYDPEPVDMSAVVPGGNPSAIVTGLIIQELDSDKNVVFQWRSWDHFQITDATHENLQAANIDYVHGNAIEVDGDSNLLISSRHMDEITKIDRQTGDILWRWGGKNNQFTFVGDTLRFSHQHAIRRLSNGHYTMFDNGNFHSPQYSRAVEYVLDPNALTAQAVWQYRNTPDTYGFAMGYVQRLDDGSTLIGWGTGKPDVIEVAPDGSKTMEMSLPTGQVSYRAFRYDWRPNLPPLGVSPGSRPVTLTAWPNPSRGLTRVALARDRTGPFSAHVYDLGGRELAHAVRAIAPTASSWVVQLDLSGQPNGVYFCHLGTPGGMQTLKLAVAR